MRRRVGTIVMMLAVAGQTWAQTTPPPTTPAAAAPVAVTDAERCSAESLSQRAAIVALRSEIARLQARVAELEAPLVEQAVEREWQQIEARIRERVKPVEGSVFNRQTLTFTAPEAPKPK